jgi:hypothetical protein
MKKYWRWFLLLLPVVVLGGFLRWKTRQPEYVLHQFIERQEHSLVTTGRATYHLEALENWKQKGVFPRSWQPHNLVGDWKGNEPLLLWASWYAKGVYAEDFDIDEKGYIWRLKSKSDNTMYGSKPILLPKYARNNLKELLHGFPAGVFPAPDLENVLIVSYRDGEEWNTHLYDRRYLPQQIRLILQKLTPHVGLPSLVSEIEKPDQTQ